MSDKTFIDTNILIYAHDRDADEKHLIAKKVIEDLWENKKGVLSIQVLEEFYVNVTKKILKPIAKKEAREIIQEYFSWEIIVINSEMVLQASHIEEKQKISFWDGLIMAAAYQGKASFLFSEDLNHGQKFENVLIQNPFKIKKI